MLRTIVVAVALLCLLLEALVCFSLAWQMGGLQQFLEAAGEVKVSMGAKGFTTGPGLPRFGRHS